MNNVLNVRSDQQDVELVMQAVGQAVQQWESGAGGVQPAPAAAWGAPLGGDSDLPQSMALLNSSWNIDSNAVIHSTRPRLGRYVIRFQQTVRRLTWWFMEPVMMQVRAFNGNATRASNGIYRRQLDEATRLDELSARVQALEAELKALRER